MLICKHKYNYDEQQYDWDEFHIHKCITLYFIREKLYDVRIKFTYARTNV